MEKLKVKFKPLQSGIISDQAKDKSIIYLDFIFENVVYQVFEELPQAHRFYLQKNNLDFVLMWFGGYRGIKKLIKEQSRQIIEI